MDSVLVRTTARGRMTEARDAKIPQNISNHEWRYYFASKVIQEELHAFILCAQLFTATNDAQFVCHISLSDRHDLLCCVAVRRVHSQIAPPKLWRCITTRCTKQSFSAGFLSRTTFALLVRIFAGAVDVIFHTLVQFLFIGNHSVSKCKIPKQKSYIYTYFI